MLNNSLKKYITFYRSSKMFKNLTRKINLEVDKTPE